MASEDKEGSLRFLLLNALANGGGVIAFLPLLSLLLPLKIERIAGDARIDVLTATVIVGALVASGSNILFGWLSDRARPSFLTRAWPPRSRRSRSWSRSPSSSSR